MRGILVSAASAVILSGLTIEPAAAQSFDASRFTPPSSLVKSVDAYCERIASPEVALVEYVDGYLAECSGSISTCLSPLTSGYGFIEIEMTPGDFVTPVLPPGFYRAEIVDAPSVQCRFFNAATLGEQLGVRLNNLKSRQKCVKLEKTDALKSKYKYVNKTEYFNVTEVLERPYVAFERIVRLSDDAIVAERIDASVRISADASINCRSPGRRADFSAIAIPPIAFAPLQ